MASRHALSRVAKQETLAVNVATAPLAVRTDVEGKEKNTARQLLQPGSCLER